MAFNAALHPRGPNGRFTRSFARQMSALDGVKASKAKAGFKARLFKGAEDARSYLRGLSGVKRGKNGGGGIRQHLDSGALGRANETLRAGKTGPEVAAIDKEMKPLPDGLDLYRSVPAKKFGQVDPKSLDGMLVSDAGYFPATIAPTKAAPGNVQVHVQAPAGTKAAVDADTGQVVLGHGVEMAVDSVDVTPDGSTRVNLVALPGEGSPAPDAPEAPDAPSAPSAPETPDAPEAPAAPAAAPEAPAVTPDAPAAPAAPDQPASTGSVGNIIDEGMPSILEGGPEANATRERARQQLGEAMNGTYAGLTADVTAASRFYGGPEGENPGVRATLVLRDADGDEVGRAERSVYRDDNGDLVAVHELLEIDDRSRGGGGLASAFNAHLTDWYREQGIRRIELTANIDVGGYAWASHGYDFADENSANGVLDRLRGALDDADAPQAAAARALLARAEGLSFGSPDYPTPFEISQLGRPEGASGREATWLGKQVMLGSAWEGTRWL